MIEFTFDKKQMRDLQSLAKKLPGLPGHFLRRLTNRADEIMSRDVLRAGGLLRVRTGRLWNSIQSIVIDNGSQLTGIVGSGVRIAGSRVKYANIHVTGGVVRAKPGKFLAIPTRHALQGTKGLLKGNATTPKECIAGIPKEKRFIRHGILWMKKGRRGIVPMFIFRKSVRIPKRDYIGATMERINREMSGIFTDSVERMAKV